MQWSSAHRLAVAWGLLVSPGAGAFAPLRPPRGATRPLGVGGMGWDNENFLEALGQGNDALRKANDEYEALSRFGRRPDFGDDGASLPASGPSAPVPSASSGDDLPSTSVPGAELTDEMKAQIKAANEAQPDGSQGGQLFREMLARAQRGGTGTPPAGTAALVPPPPPPAAVPPVAAASLDSLTVEQQAELFRQMMAQQQQIQPPQPQAPKPLAIDPAALPRRTAGGDDRKRVGRNRDADAIVNSSDVYFAQLKLDSTLRNYARYSGDDDKANQVFADPSIREIKAHVNPVLQEMRQKEAALLETAADEMLIMPDPTVGTPNSGKDRSYAGVSYKQKLLQRQKRQQSGNDGAANASAGSGAATASIAATPPSAAAYSDPAPPAAPAVVSAPITTAASQVSFQPTTAKTSTSPAVAAQPPAAGADDAGTPDEESLRRDIRTFMGLLLKHRGGPGFGAGRLQGAEVERFTALADKVLPALKRQAVPNDAAHSATPSSSPSSLSPSPSQSQAAAPSALSPPSTAASSADTPTTAARVQNMITCIEGGIQMYRNSPPELREGVLVTFRAALVSAINTVTEILEPSGQPALSAASASSSSSGDGASQTDDSRVNAMISLIEGAIVMYKNSPPELQTGILVTLRAALLSAIGTLNSIIALNEVENVRAYQAAASSVAPAAPAPPAHDTPLPFYEVVPSKPTGETPEAAASTTAPEKVTSALTGTDANSQFFEELRGKLERAKGDGSMGLRTDLSGSTAAELADDLARMRSLLVQELENGIPSSSSSSSSTGDSEGSSTTTSRYQEKLAKARSEKLS